MPHIVVNGARLSYKDHGVGLQTILFAHGLLQLTIIPGARHISTVEEPDAVN